MVKYISTALNDELFEKFNRICSELRVSKSRQLQILIEEFVKKQKEVKK
jgi:metal-responsive CopG/Arc/MetJ family transcriptional regulator